MKTLVWFRQDLRLYDNPALFEAAQRGPVIPVFILDEEGCGEWRPGGASRWWLHHSLRSLQQQFARKGTRLILRRGPALKVLQDLVEKTGVTAIAWNRSYDPHSVVRDKAIKNYFLNKGLCVTSHNGALLTEPWEILTGQGTPYKVFTPYWRQASGQIDDSTPYPVPDLETVASLPKSDDLGDWRLLPGNPDWSGGLAWRWTPGEQGAQRRFEAFLEKGLPYYATKRDRPDAEAISGLSAHLHFGEISVRDIWRKLRLFEDLSDTATSVTKFRSELGWREFGTYLLFHFPHLPERPFRPEFVNFPWRDDKEALRRWQKGQTGYPIVDAGMRELWHTGFMHNRVRMIVASFLTKHLLIPWQVGARWFWDTLVDADLANNSAGWQWVAGCGADASPYFRIFNPVMQGEKFDSDGRYVRRWVPEVGALPDKYVHAPWRAPREVLMEAGVVLGKTYPAPIVDHAAARERALAAYKSMK